MTGFQDACFRNQEDRMNWKEQSERYEAMLKNTQSFAVSGVSGSWHGKMSESPRMAIYFVLSVMKSIKKL